eukprot:SAG11_NODE_6133_length_1382_cov_1.239283_1_plen_403_part_10
MTLANALSVDSEWALADMLGHGLSESEFFEQYWQQKPLSTAGTGHNKVHVRKIRRLLSMGAMEALTNSPAFRSRMTSVVQQISEGGVGSAKSWWQAGALEPLSVHGLGFDEKTLQYVSGLQRAFDADYHDLHEAYLDGSTVNLNSLEYIWAPIDSLCNALMRRFEWMFTVNAYITPREAKGYTPHTDHQDVFILQLDGVKQWTVYHRPIKDALAEHKVGTPGSADPTGLEGWNGTPTWQGKLAPGDLLYIPRGWVHDAHTGPAGPSMHLTITANTNGHSVGVFIKHMLTLGQQAAAGKKASRRLDKALRALHLAAVAGEPLRAALPVRMGSDPAARAKAKPIVKQALQLLRGRVEGAGLQCKGCGALLDRLLGAEEFETQFKAVMEEAYNPAAAALQAEHERR